MTTQEHNHAAENPGALHTHDGLAPHTHAHEHAELGAHAHTHAGEASEAHEHAHEGLGHAEGREHTHAHEHDGLAPHAHGHAHEGGEGDHIHPAVAEVRAHEASHGDALLHHGHTHAAGAKHEGGCHLLQVEDLCVSFRMYDPEAPFFSATQSQVEVIHNLGISVHAGEIVAVVGASGSGKTLLADAVLGLFEPNATVTGTVWFNGYEQDAASLARLRGNGISLVPQSVNNLDPLMKVGRQVESFAHPASSRAERTARRKELFARYGLAEEVAGLYPFELSGGMARRVLLCCALMDDPKLIVADEPTPGLDLDLALAALADFRAFANAGGGVMLITHDIELALRVADRVAVFKDGTVIEETAVANFASPETLVHPFSRALWHALPEHSFASPTSEDELELDAIAAAAGEAGDVRNDAQDGGQGFSANEAAGAKEGEGAC